MQTADRARLTACSHLQGTDAMHWSQISLAVALTVYVGAFVAIVLAVRRATGETARGHARGHTLAALFSERTPIHSGHSSIHDHLRRATS